MSNFANNDNMTALFTATGTKIGERAKIFYGAEAEWNALPLSEKVKYDYATFKGDSQSGVVDDIPTEDSENLVKSGGVFDSLATKANLTQISNPNILINPWFTINQRGFTTNTSASNTYVADRWKVVSASDITITNDANGITIDNTNGSSIVTLETLIAPNVSKSLLGRILTMSLSKEIGKTDVWKTFTMPVSLPQSSTVIAYVNTEEYTLRTVITGNGYVKIDVQVNKGKSVTIRAIKLEIGEATTLARDPRPDKATELAKCQRYFQRFTIQGTSSFAIGIAAWAQGIRFYLPYTEQNKSPTLSVSEGATSIGYTKTGSAAAQPITGLAITYIQHNQICLTASITSATAGDVFSLFNLSSNTNYIDFNAEL